ncbi:MAG: V-type ATPase subunit [Trueperaceae bacterium]|nr:V-type ATPase subunit [Trueperaceae bacterium]MCW5820645.1 V-type ATPase subunit [Trueperaceae bacterium]
MSSDYGYINARVKGMKAKLLGQAFYQTALDASDFKTFTAGLMQTPYMRELEEAQARASGLGAVDQAVARNVYHTAHGLLTFSDGQARQLIGMLLMRFDLANVKAIARGKHAGKGLEEIQGSLFPAGELKPSLLEQAAVASDMAAAAQVLALARTEVTSAFLRAARRYQNEPDLYTLEVVLDQAYYAGMLERAEAAKAPAALKRHLQLEIDAANLRTALKVRGMGAGAARDLFIRGGRELRRDTFEALIGDQEGALSALTGGTFAAVVTAVQGDGGLGAAEAEIRKVLDEDAKRISYAPLEIGVVVDYLRRKEAEAAQLRLLARGKFYGVPRAALERELTHA